MRKIALLAGIAALAACNQETPVAPETAEPAAEAVATVANGSPVGTFEATSADGTVGTTVINADGTYTDSDADGKVTVEGTWAVVDGKTCFTPTTEGEKPMCFTESAPAADGSFTATPDEGEAVTVRPVAAK